MYQLLTRLGLVPDAVVGHSSGELLALSAAGVFPADRALEQKLGRLGSIFRSFESSGDLPEAHLVAIAADRERVEAICRALGSAGSAVAMDNCPHQVVLAVPSAEIEPLVGRLREESILWEDLPFSRAYHTPSFEAVVGPHRRFLQSHRRSIRRKSRFTPVLHAGACPRNWARFATWPSSSGRPPSRFRETIEAMYADGLRLFVDVGARGNLAGFVEDILRGKPAFAVAANLPRRSGLAQLNHLVASLFAQGVFVDAGYLYARRRPRLIDWNAPEPPARATVELALGFPEMRLSESLVARLRAAAHPDAAPDVNGDETMPLRHPPAAEPREGPERAGRNGTLPPRPSRTAARRAPLRRHARDSRRWSSSPQSPSPWPPSLAEDAMLAFQQTMQAFLQTQQEVLAHTSEAALNRLPKPVLIAYDGLATDLSPVATKETADGQLLHGPSPASTTRVTTGATPGPWCGEVRALVPGHEVESLVILEVHDDPIAFHHTLGGRKVSALDPSLKGLPVLPFAVMAEMTAQAAALAATPGLVLLGLCQVKAHKWVRYEEEPVFLELRGRRAAFQR